MGRNVAQRKIIFKWKIQMFYTILFAEYWLFSVLQHYSILLIFSPSNDIEDNRICGRISEDFRNLTTLTYLSVAFCLSESGGWNNVIYFIVTFVLHRRCRQNCVDHKVRKLVEILLIMYPIATKYLFVETLVSDRFQHNFYGDDIDKNSDLRYWKLPGFCLWKLSLHCSILQYSLWLDDILELNMFEIPILQCCQPWQGIRNGSLSLFFSYLTKFLLFVFFLAPLKLLNIDIMWWSDCYRF